MKYGNKVKKRRHSNIVQRKEKGKAVWKRNKSQERRQCEIYEKEGEKAENSKYK